MALLSAPAALANATVVDMHSHVSAVRPSPRLLLLEAEARSLQEALEDPAAQPPGRPLTSHYTSLEQKMHFMDRHHIDVSVISLANPWLDFVDPSQAGHLARSINEFSHMCGRHPGRLFFFGTLHLTAPAEVIRSSVQHLERLEYCRGVVMGTSGLGQGLDDPQLVPVFQALADAGLTVFLHPHDGLPSSLWGPRAREYGHVLPLALGFPMQTTIAMTRMYLAGVFDKVRNLRMLLAHSGGTLPFLAGRIESCILHDGQIVREAKAGKGRRSVWDVLKEQVYLDAVIYSSVALKAAMEAAGGDRLLFGTDHPFFPPLASDDQAEWESVRLNVDAVANAFGEHSAEAKAIMGHNAVRVLRLGDMSENPARPGV